MGNIICSWWWYFRYFYRWAAAFPVWGKCNVITIAKVKLHPELSCVAREVREEGGTQGRAQGGAPGGAQDGAQGGAPAGVDLS